MNQDSAALSISKCRMSSLIRLMPMRVKCICDLESIGSGGRGPVPPGRLMVGDGSGRPKIVVASMPVGVAGELVEGILLIPVGVMGTAATTEERSLQGVQLLQLEQG